MKANHKNEAGEVFQHTDGVWSIPRADLNGFCNDHYAAHFMEGSLTSCTRAVNMDQNASSDC